MKSHRREDECINCGEVQPIAGKGLCYRCYRAAGRVKERAEREVDRHNPAIRREHKKLFKAQANIMAGLSDLGVSRDDVMEIKVLLQPYLRPIQEYLDRVVNSEQSEHEFSVHSEPEAGQEQQEPEPSQESPVITKPGSKKVQ